MPKEIKDYRFTSSAAVYGDAKNIPTAEEENLTPLSVYGVSKQTSENLAIMYNKQIGSNGAIYRPSNIYVPRQRNDLEVGVVSIFTKSALSSVVGLIYGDGKQTRDFIYVEDIANYITAEIGKNRLQYSKFEYWNRNVDYRSVKIS